MPIRVAVPKETWSGEKRVAMVPAVIDRLKKLGVEVSVEASAGEACGIPDNLYKDATIVGDAKALYESADVILGVQPPAVDAIKQFKKDAIFIGFMQPHTGDDRINALKAQGVTSFSMELVPRISRAQAIDALSSQANAAGYKAVLMAANLSTRYFPMLTTAAGTIRPSKVLIIGAGVAGLQAIATARRLGAIVEAYDVRSATKEQCESLGAKFIDTGVKAEGEGGYARELTDDEKKQQQEVLDKHIQQADVVVTTAAIPGRPAPKIISKAVVDGMKPGSVIVDLAAETGGNCEYTQAGEEVRVGTVTVFGPVNVPSTIAFDTSEMYARNILNLMMLMVKDGELNLNWEDQIIAESVVTHAGEIRHAATRNRIEGGQS